MGVHAAERGAGVSVVFYAGHGIEMDGVNYVVPVDARLERDVDVRFETVTRNERTRTVAALPFEARLRDSAPPPAYQRLAAPAAAFRAIGWSDHSIGVELGVTAKTIAKAIRWLRGRPGLQGWLGWLGVEVVGLR